MKVDIGPFLERTSQVNLYIENTFPFNLIPDCNLLDVLPDYSNRDPGVILEANLQLGCMVTHAAVFKSDNNLKNNLIYPIVIVGGKASCAHFTKRNGWNCYQLIYTQTGAGILNMDNRMYDLKPGSLFLLDCRPYHYFYANDNSGWEYTYIHFDGGNSRYLYQLAKENSNLYSNMAGTRILQKYNRLFELSLGDSDDFELNFHELMTQILVGFCLEKTAVSTPLDVPAWLSDVQTYIVTNYNKELRVNDLAKMAYLSPSRFAHRFKELIGDSPIEYQYKLRIAHAKEHLASTDMALNEICERVGFNNETNFYARFKRSTGLPPGKFRRQAKNSE